MNLSDTKLLLTRPEQASCRFLAELRARGAPFCDVVISPLIRIAALPATLPDTPSTAYVFTSANAVTCTQDRLAGQGRRAWCVGRQTAAAARAAGFDVIAGYSDAAALVDIILRDPPDGPIVHLAGRHRRGNLVGQLVAAGFKAETVEVYDQVAQPLTPEARALLLADTDVVAPVFSPRSTRLLIDAGSARRARVHLVAISQATAEEWSIRPGEKVEIATQTTSTAMIDAMFRVFKA